MKRFKWLFILTTIGVALQQGWAVQLHDYAMRGTLSPDAHLAIEIRCESLAAADVDVECRDDLAEQFLAGALDPEATLRAHCTSFYNTWADAEPEPPALCVERYGGWRSS